MIWAAVARSRWQIFRNAFTTRPKRGSLHPLLAGVLGLLLVLIVTRALSTVFQVTAAADVTIYETGTMLGLLLTGVAFGLLVFDLHEAVSTLLADTDLELLRRAPIQARDLFVLKLADALPRTSLLIVILAVPGVLAFNEHYPLPLWAWPLLVVQLGALWAIPLGLGAAAAIRMLCIVPPHRARETFGLLSAIVFLVLWIANAFVLPRLAVNGMQTLEHPDVLAHPPLAMQLSPGHWAGQAIAAAAEHAPSEAVAGTVLLVVLATLSLGLAALVAAHDLDTAQARIHAGTASPRPSRTRPSFGNHGFAGVMIERDLKIILRDWSVLADVMTGLVLWTLLPLIAVPVAEGSPDFFYQAMLVVLAVAVGYEVAARLFAIERRGATWMRLAPIAPSRFIAAKFATGAALSLPLAAFATFVLSLAFRLPPETVAAAVGTTLPALVTSLSLGLWTGAAFSQPGWTNPRAMLTLAGRVVAMGWLVVQTMTWLAVVVVNPSPSPATIAMSFAGAAVIASLALVAATRVVARSDIGGSG